MGSKNKDIYRLVQQASKTRIDQLYGLNILKYSNSHISQYSVISQEAFSNYFNKKQYLQGQKVKGHIRKQYELNSFRPISVESLGYLDRFEPRHNGSSKDDIDAMLKEVGCKTEEELAEITVPKEIQMNKLMDLKEYTKGLSETEFLKKIKSMATQNKLLKNFIGIGYYGTKLPQAIQRNLLENPGWYTQYTPYQSEIAQGRLESLLNYQTMITDLTGLEMSNASLLDEGTAAAEAMAMSYTLNKQKRALYYISDKCHPQTIDNCLTRAYGLGIQAKVVNENNFQFNKDVCGVIVQYPNSDGTVRDYSKMISEAKKEGVVVTMATDLLALTQLKPPGEYGADIAIGTAQRFGVPMGYGGPHAAFLATSAANKRLTPGRIIGISQDSQGRPAFRMAMQTREQHIRREKATSNICTSQALLANISAMYAVYHGPEGLNQIATKVNALAKIFQAGVQKLGFKIDNEIVFDTVRVDTHQGSDKIIQQLLGYGINARRLDDKHVCVAFDETHNLEDVEKLLEGFNGAKIDQFDIKELAEQQSQDYGKFKRTSKYLQRHVFNAYHTEHELLRYLKRLENRDLSLCHSMIPLGSCTMKLNATSEMVPITWDELANLHPFVPLDQAKGYQLILEDLAMQLCEITQFDAISMQPNAGASGEYAGLMTIQAYHRSRGDHNRKVCLIPTSAHGTNPASAVMSGMSIVNIKIGSDGYVDVKDLQEKAEKNKDQLGAFMITYPSTCGVFEEGIEQMCEVIHKYGGQVYMDGANMNAQVGLTAPGLIGADVCHLNLHKTFCIPHGGGGPGMGPIGVKAHLARFLPGHPIIKTHGLPSTAKGVQGEKLEPFGSVAAAPYGSSLILPISYAYISMMGSKGLATASKRAILNANYMSKKLQGSYPVLYSGKNNTCAHEFIIELKHIKGANIEAEDIAKRLIDYGYHSPTMSWPVTGTLMIEPTESETKQELDRFCEAMISIRQEIRDIEEGRLDIKNNPLKNAPHTAEEVISEKWDRPYSREMAAFPAPWTRVSKFWPSVSRVDNVGGDRILVTTLQKEHDKMFAAW